MKKQSNIVEYQFEASQFEWEIAEGKTIQAWGFNKQVPGPIIKARKGDTLVVRLKNSLSESTMIHWHGIRVPASMDGTGEVQKPVAPGEEFEYRFQVEDAGSFWYHSHHNETVQMERGMYGAIVVEDELDPVVDEEKIFMIDDMKLTANFEFTKPSWALPRLIEKHDGRQGDTLLINGKVDSLLHMHARQMERWRFINASSARYFKLYLGGREFKIIGSDGGLIEQPVVVREALITPGERLDIMVGPFKEGEIIPIDSLSYSRSTFLRPKKETFASVKVLEAKPSVANIPPFLRVIEPLAPQEAAINRKVKFSVGPSLKNGMNFLINNGLHVLDEPVKVGELQVWEIDNVSLMDHPFHLHGFFFQVLEINGKAPAYKAWKDTINLTPRTKVKIAWMPDNRPGKWMYHCHILEHHAAGMMASFEVIDAATPYVTSRSSCHSH
ncbi:multicopper oxidase family protein [Rhodocytophaga aerolata]|uniref:Multicopper oxidase family protein n=1 Tax=Rhodocytophaga aerolata TaxID=455078 RepID=A0ABT8RGP8_9BACT|nr:multicopper oxidase family protein [Rhodocytophaga aerolata]MDO1451281.1 multicopper oxidase family protein [Rhodocytophaga aerolata]